MHWRKGIIRLQHHLADCFEQMSSNCLRRPLLVQDFQISSHFYLQTMWLYAWKMFEITNNYLVFSPFQIDLVLADQYQDVWGYNNEVFELARESLNIIFRILLLLQLRQGRNNKVDTSHLLSHFLLHRIIGKLLRKLFSVHLIKICFVWIQSWLCFLSRRQSFRRIIGWHTFVWRKSSYTFDEPHRIPHLRSSSELAALYEPYYSDSFLNQLIK